MNPSSPAFVLPDPVGSVLSRLPAYPGSFLLVTALNKVLAKQLPADVRQYLLGKKLRIHVTDARLTFDFTCTGTRFVASHRQDSTDLTISANAQDFLRLAQRQEDPDTLCWPASCQNATATKLPQRGMGAEVTNGQSGSPGRRDIKANWH